MYCLAKAVKNPFAYSCLSALSLPESPEAAGSEAFSDLAAVAFSDSEGVLVVSEEAASEEASTVDATELPAAVPFVFLPVTHPEAEQRMNPALNANAQIFKFFINQILFVFFMYLIKGSP